MKFVDNCQIMNIKKLSGVLLPLLLAASHVAAQSEPKAKLQSLDSLVPGLGALHHEVTTSNRQAQEFFDQGLRLIYAFNHQDAARSFRRSAELDPKCAISWS